jgi:ribosomal protein S4
MTEDLIQKLMISKKIMEKSDNIKRGEVQNVSEQSVVSRNIQVQDFDIPQPSYNIPQEFMAETKQVSTKPFVNTNDKILNSKLPDVIKQLMIEHPIQQPQQSTPVLSDELIERASRLMNKNGNSNTISETVSNKKQTVPTNTTNGDLKKMLKEVIMEVLTEKGIIHESEQKSQQIVQIKVGNHIFEGKISKIKKLK